MELARVTNLKPRIEERQTAKEQQLGHQTSKEQQLGHQSTNPNTNHLERLNLNATHLHQEPNTPEENYPVPKPKLDFKVLVERMAAAALPRDSDTQITEKVSDLDYTTPPTQVSDEKSYFQHQQLPRYTQL